MPKFLVGVLAGVILGLFLAAMFPDAIAGALSYFDVSAYH